jgi:DNA polymerase
MHTITPDTETRSAANLRDCGAHIYARHSKTAPLCLVYTVDDAEPELWLPSDPVPPLFFCIAVDPDGYEVFAHNAEFDRAVYVHVLVPRYGFPALPLEVWHCTQRIAMANGLPAELDRLAIALGLPYCKDPEARKAMLAVSKPKQPRGKKAKSNSGEPVFDEDPAKLALTYERCKLDVITTRAALQSPQMKRLSPLERRYQIQDMVINRRGVRLDRVFTEAAKELATRERIAINLRLQDLTAGDITSIDQVARFLKAVNERGHAMTSMSKRSVAQVLAGKPDGYVTELLTCAATALVRASASLSRCSPMPRLRTIGFAGISGCMALVPGVGPGSVRNCRTSRRTKPACRFRWWIPCARASVPRSRNTVIPCRCSATSAGLRFVPRPAMS